MLGLFLAVALCSQGPEPSSTGYQRAHRAADAALVAGDTEQAITQFKHCLKLSPENPTVAYGLACSEARAGNTRRAMHWFETALRWGYTDADVVLWDRDIAPLLERRRFNSALKAIQDAGDPSASPEVLVRIVPSSAKVSPTDAVIDPGGRFMAVGRTDGVIELLDATSGSLVRRSRPLGSPVWAVALHPRGHSVAALTWDGRVHLWSTAGDDEPLHVDALAPAAEDDELGWSFGAFLEFDSTGKRLFAAAVYRGWCLLDDGGEVLRYDATPIGHFFAVRAAWSPNGSGVAIVRKGLLKTVSFVDSGEGGELALPIDCPSDVLGLDLSPDGKRLATGHDDAHLRVWNVETGELLFEDEFIDPWPLDGGHIPRIRDVRFSPDGNQVAYSTDPSVNVIVFDLESGERVAEHDTNGGRLFERVPVCWSPDGPRLWFAYAGGAMNVWQLDWSNEVTACTAVTRGSPPRPSAGRISAVVHWSGVSALDLSTGRFTWYRPTGDDLELLQAPSGHFTSNLDAVEGLRVSHEIDSRDPPPLSDFVERLFDPKRVRAARDGVKIKPVEFSRGE